MLASADYHIIPSCSIIIDKHKMGPERGSVSSEIQNLVFVKSDWSRNRKKCCRIPQSVPTNFLFHIFVIHPRDMHHDKPLTVLYSFLCIEG